jgi:hypothetical protein
VHFCIYPAFILTWGTASKLSAVTLCICIVNIWKSESLVCPIDESEKWRSSLSRTVAVCSINSMQWKRNQIATSLYVSFYFYNSPVLHVKVSKCLLNPTTSMRPPVLQLQVTKTESRERVRILALWRRLYYFCTIRLGKNSPFLFSAIIFVVYYKLFAQNA